MYDSVVFHVLLSLCFKFDSIVLIILFLNFILFCTALWGTSVVFKCALQINVLLY